jgi:hypothetical protein
MKNSKKKKTNMRTVIRKIVREEVAMAIQEVINELKQPSLSSKPAKPVKKKSFTKNSVLNDVLNETAQGDWKQLGGTQYTTERMSEVMGNSYGDMMKDTSEPNANIAAEMGVNPNAPGMDFLKKDYRDVMKAIDKKKGIK